MKNTDDSPKWSIETVLKRLIFVVALVTGFFHLFNVSGLVVISTQTLRIFHLGLMILLVFLQMALPGRQ
jgi:hypothetical protein